jgi:methyl-accepting chemotaxis protein
MTWEDMERTMAFIIEQQAQFHSNMAEINSTMARQAERLDRLTERTDRNAEGITALLAIAEIQAAEIRDLGETTRALADRQRESEERGRQTDERLNVLINTVERYISERRNGKA